MKINVTQYLDRTAAAMPEKTAVVDAGGEVSFRALRERALVLAGRIVEMGVHNSPVPVFLPKGCDMVTAFAGVNYSGNFYVPLDVKSPAARVGQILESLGCGVVVTSREMVDKLPATEARVVFVEDGGGVDMEAVDVARFGCLDTDPVYSIFTSGSTGMPKGVVISHRGVVDYIDWAVETFEVGSEAVIGNQAPFYFDNSTLDLYLMFAVGATLVVVPEEYYAFPAKLIDYMNERRVNFVFWVPFVLINIANFDLLASKRPQWLTKVLFAGEVMPNKHLNYWRRHMPDCLYANLYGPTEITVDCTYYIVDRDFGDEEPLPIGVPCRNSGVLILDEDDRSCGVGEQGELCVRGSGVALGYYNDPERTSSAFVQNPLNRHYPEIIYRTGDIAYWNDRGEVMYVGRKDSQIKHNGYRIELGEIETAVLGTGMVKSVCVVYDHVRREIVMFYVGDVEVDMGVLRRKMLDFVPKYMVPAKCHRLERMPMNANGKIDRLKLSRQVNG